MYLHDRAPVVTGACLGVLVDETVQKLHGCEVLQRIAGIDYSFSLRGEREMGEGGERRLMRSKGRLLTAAIFLEKSCTDGW